MPARRRKVSPFMWVLMSWTLLSHAAVGLAVSAVARGLHVPWPGALGLLAAVVLFAPFRDRMLALMPDRPRSIWKLRLLEIPYFAHWCASAVALVWTVLAAALWAPTRLISGYSAFELPNAAVWGYAAGAVLAGWGVLVRRKLVKVRRLALPIRGLDPSFDGYTIVQLSDLHIGSFSQEPTGLRWARIANRIQPDLIAVTGDLVTNGSAFHGQIVNVMCALCARDAVVVSPGNHDYFGDGESLIAKLRSRGVQVLRNQSIQIERGDASLLVAGVDDTWTGRADLAAALRKRRPGQPAVLLAHDPDLYPSAANAAVQLVLSGHTHGGQVAMPFAARWLNLSRLSHRFHLGLYSNGASHLYVNGGLGTTGPPVRLGSPPEITVVRLRCA